jgi:hypothetical protein
VKWHTSAGALRAVQPWPGWDAGAPPPLTQQMGADLNEPGAPILIASGRAAEQQRGHVGGSRSAGLVPARACRRRPCQNTQDVSLLLAVGNTFITNFITINYLLLACAMQHAGRVVKVELISDTM